MPRPPRDTRPPPSSADLREGGTWTRRQRVKNDLIHAAVGAALAFLLLLPRAATASLCAALAALAYRIRPREREAVRRRLAAGTAVSPVPEARVRAAFRAAGALLADTLALLDPREPAGRTLALDPAGREAFRAALAEGRGVVFIAAHLGSWERMAALLVAEGFPVATIARESYDPRFTLLYERLRAPRGVRSIYRGRAGAPTAIVRELRAGRAVGFLVDLPARVPSIPARLFGADVAIAVGPARIALARRAAVVVGTCAPPDGPGLPARVLIERVPLGDLQPGGEGERALTDRLVSVLEARIAAHPEAWLGLFTAPAAGPRPDDHAAPRARFRTGIAADVGFSID